MLHYHLSLPSRYALAFLCVTTALVSSPAHLAQADSPFQANAPQPGDKHPAPALSETPATRTDVTSKADADLESRTLPPPKTRTPTLSNGSSDTVAGVDNRPSMWRALISLIVVVVLIMAGAYVFRRFSIFGQRPRKASGVDVLARSPIGTKQSLCLIKFGRRLLLVGQGPNFMNTLDAIEDPDDVARVLGLLEKQGPESVSNNFSRLFHQEAHQYESSPATELTDNEFDDSNPSLGYQSKSELASLLDKVKGLTKIRSRN